MNIQVLRAMLLNIFKDLQNLSKSFEKDKINSEVLKKVYHQRKEYVRKYATDEKMEKFLISWYKYFFGCVVNLTAEGVTNEELTEFYAMLYTATESFLVSKKLTYNELDNLGVTVGKGYVLARKYKSETFPNTWFSELSQYLFDEILIVEDKKTKVCTQ
ncbi:MAG: hypothetical protein IJM28_05295 [Lachnospiraceae bacterium]|nr:hypothetical protein [Lachnospiraceae bacterium]